MLIRTVHRRISVLVEWSSDMKQANLRSVVRAKLEASPLLRHPSTRSWAGFGTNRRCTICDEQITREAIEVEAECADGQIRFYHELCHRILTEERDHPQNGAERR
jgi:hypothetical protein